VAALGTDAPNAAGLVYIAAFGLDEGESIGALLEQGPLPPLILLPSRRYAAVTAGAVAPEAGRPGSCSALGPPADGR
jgi:hypothetical protein